MLCRYFKSRNLNLKELSISSEGERLAETCMNEDPSSDAMPTVLNSRAAFNLSRAFDTLKGFGMSFAFLTMGLMPLTPDAQTLNAIQLASLSRESETPKMSPPTPSSLQLQVEAQNWLAQQLSLQVQQVQIADMDARLKVQPCGTGVTFDHPFANRQVIRARCESPVWQFFLKASFSDEQAALKASRLQTPIAPSKSSTPAPGVTTKGPNTYNLTTSANLGLLGNKVKTVLVANQPLRKGTLLQASFFKQIEMTIASTDTMVLSQFKEIENTELLHDMGTDQAIRNYDIKPTLLVKRGQQVNFSIGEGRGFLITIKTEAQQDGTLGEQIKLKNVESGRLISGVITGLNEARAL